MYEFADYMNLSISVCFWQFRMPCINYIDTYCMYIRTYVLYVRIYYTFRYRSIEILTGKRIKIRNHLLLIL